VQESEASWQTSAALRRLRSPLLANVVEEKLRNLERAVKANFNPNQPRVPRGNPDGGLKLGNPRVRFTDPNGRIRTMRNGTWKTGR
jgi:hypothetical protein